MKNRPNILFLFPDQLSARWLPCYGNAVVHAPNLLNFADQSVQFNRAYTNSPLCTPYRVCLLTGQYPSQTGVTENGMSLPVNQPTLAHHLNQAGYGTNYIGKWHLSGKPHENRRVPPGQRGGFQHFIGWESHHVDHNAGLIWYDDSDSPRKLRGHETDGLTDIVVEELERLSADDSPFFMAVSYQAPHAPNSPPSQYRELYGKTVLDDPPNTVCDAWFKNTGWNADYGVEEFRKRYFGEISHLDAAFGRVLNALKSTGLAESTVVVFTSDHGDMAGCRGLFGKGVMFDESVRVPLLIRLPGRAAETVESPVSTVDLYSTILSLTGAEPKGDVEGCSVMPCTSNAPDTPRDIFIEYKEDCIIRGDLKLVTKRNEDAVLHCYDLAGDPYELVDLAETLGRETRDSLLLSLNEWRNRTRN